MVWHGGSSCAADDVRESRRLCELQKRHDQDAKHNCLFAGGQDRHQDVEVWGLVIRHGVDPEYSVL
jgi:hypothetical protein